jgi:enoyl-[acyl-carrier-protein] reductase (NADH)
MIEMMAEMKADKEERKTGMQTNQVKVEANMKIHMQEIMVEMKADQDAHMQEIVAKIDGIKDKMEATVHSIRSELDGKIQCRIKNMEQQEIPNEEAAVHTMRAWQQETMACQEMMEANPEKEEPSPEEMESEVECQEVPMENAIEKPVRERKKR